MKRTAVRVWEFPVRLVHWTNFLAIVVLCLTGVYIHWPFLAAPAGSDAYVMGLMRYAHFVAGWVLLAGLLARLYWGFVGNRYARLGTFFPYLTAEGRRHLWGVLRYYALLSSRLPPHLGHNAMAATVYGGVFLLLAFQVLSGFALLGLHDPSGTTYRLTGWLIAAVGGGWVRFAHYTVTFVLGAFLIAHVYAMWVCDLAERDGTSGSMFSGYKYGEDEHVAYSDSRAR